jgi:hypothetical protein
LDDTPLLDEEEANHYMSHISILHWTVELGHLNIYINVALLSSFLMQPRKGHLEAVYGICGYLKHHNHSTMVFDNQEINWNDTDSVNYDWKDFYNDSAESIPCNALEPRGKSVQILHLWLPIMPDSMSIANHIQEFSST